MDTRNLETLLAIVDHGGFAAAAKATGLSTSGVSVHVKALEDEFGLVLFDRSKRPPVLTDAGARFVERAREAMASWRRLTREMAEIRAGGVLNLGAIHTAVSGVLPAALGKLRLTNKDLVIRLTAGLSHELEEQVRAGTLDAAITVRPQTVSSGLEWEPFCEEELAVVAAIGTRMDDYRQVLENNDYIRFARQAWVGRQIAGELTGRGIRVNTVMEVDNLDGVFSLVENKLGVSIVPKRQIARPFPPDVQHIPFGDPVVTRELGVMQREVNPRRHLVEELLTVTGFGTRVG